MLVLEAQMVTFVDLLRNLHSLLFHCVLRLTAIFLFFCITRPLKMDGRFGRYFESWELLYWDGFWGDGFYKGARGEGGRGTAEYDTTGYWEFLGGFDTLTYSKTSIILPANHISLYN